MEQSFSRDQTSEIPHHWENMNAMAVVEITLTMQKKISSNP